MATGLLLASRSATAALPVEPLDLSMFHDGLKSSARIVLLGRVGRGKTTLIQAILLLLTERYGFDRPLLHKPVIISSTVGVNGKLLPFTVPGNVLFKLTSPSYDALKKHIDRLRKSTDGLNPSIPSIVVFDDQNCDAETQRNMDALVLNGRNSQITCIIANQQANRGLTTAVNSNADYCFIGDIGKREKDIFYARVGCEFEQGQTKKDFNKFLEDNLSVVPQSDDTIGMNAGRSHPWLLFDKVNRCVRRVLLTDRLLTDIQYLNELDPVGIDKFLGARLVDGI